MPKVEKKVAKRRRPQTPVPKAARHARRFDDTTSRNKISVKPQTRGRSGHRAAVRVRRAFPADVSTIARFNAAMALETEGKKLDPKILVPGVEGLLLRPSFGFYLVAEADGKPVGQTMVTFEWSDWRNGPFFWIQSVYVKPAWRARGVFRALHDAVEREAKQFGACGLRLYVERENERAQSVYRHLGYSTTHYRMLEKNWKR